MYVYRVVESAQPSILNVPGFIPNPAIIFQFLILVVKLSSVTYHSWQGIGFWY